MKCANYGNRIVQVGLVDKWMLRSLPAPDRNSYDELMYTFWYTFCKFSVTEPVIEVIDTPLDKSKQYIDLLGDASRLAYGSIVRRVNDDDLINRRDFKEE